MKKLIVMLAVVAFGAFAMAQGNAPTTGTDTTGAATGAAPTDAAKTDTGDKKDAMAGKKTAHHGKKHGKKEKKEKTEGAM